MPRLSDVVAPVSRCAASPRRARLAENHGKPSLWVFINAPWYYYPDTNYPAARLYADMLEQATLAEQLGFTGLTVPEHHFINILMNPGPLLLALKVADATKRIPIRTAVLVLPFLDMKRLAGEIGLTDCLTGGRLEIGVGRGAFAYEFKRFGVPVEDSRARFDESLAVLEALLSREEVSWDGDTTTRSTP